MSNKVFNVLFLCDTNSARSIMAEAILNRWGSQRFRAFSAGIECASEVDPIALELLKAGQVSTEGLGSKHWREFTSSAAPRMDFVISLCDMPVAKLKGVFPGDPIVAHWTITDPASGSENPTRRKTAFRHAFQEIETRVRLFTLVRHEPAIQAAAQQPNA
jgi:protein-tyrosine-phosphatase